jgi:hypothetical protein
MQLVKIACGVESILRDRVGHFVSIEVDRSASIIGPDD